MTAATGACGQILWYRSLQSGESSLSTLPVLTALCLYIHKSEKVNPSAAYSPTAFNENKLECAIAMFVDHVSTSRAHVTSLVVVDDTSRGTSPFDLQRLWELVGTCCDAHIL